MQDPLPGPSEEWSSPEREDGLRILLQAVRALDEPPKDVGAAPGEALGEPPTLKERILWKGV